MVLIFVMILANGQILLPHPPNYAPRLFLLGSRFRRLCEVLHEKSAKNAFVRSSASGDCPILEGIHLRMTQKPIPGSLAYG